jgi:hypothetical protein
MPYIILGLLIVALVLGPQLWVRYAMRSHGAERTDLPGTGGELARHLLDEAGLRHVKVELTGDGDHYDPATETVRLRPEHHDARSITAVAVAAHEVSHAVQHARGEKGFLFRQVLVERAVMFDRIGMMVLLAAPLLFFIIKAPVLLLLQFLLGIGLMLVRVVVHLATLPIEVDASFRKALPVLQAGGYLDDRDLPAARSVLTAAALTYVASALATLLDFARWIRLIRP